MESTDAATVTHSQSQGESRTTSTTLTHSTSNPQSTSHVHHGTGPHRYITHEGREAAEDPTEVEDVEKDRKFRSPSESSPERFEPFNANEEGVLRRLASSMRSQSYYGDRAASLAATEAQDDSLERKGTLEGLEPSDEVFDPRSPKFDLYKWIRLTLRLFDQEGIKFKRAGITFKNVNVTGSGSALNLQKNVGSMFMAPLRLGEMLTWKKTPRHILHDFSGMVKSGELLIVLGRPGSGCSTFLKTITGQMHGLKLDQGSTIHYNGIPQKQMIKEFKGEVIYNQEVDKHFPHLTVGETLEHAAAMRMPQHRPLATKRIEVVKHVTQVVMAVYGLSHTYHTKVGNDFVRGVSGGERKRVSIAEMALAGSALAAWDNSTRGLDSATALTFVKSLRMTADLEGSAHAVAIYQASQAIYDLFDTAVVLYEGRQIFFGKADTAKAYFERMGWFCPARQTTGDFLTSVTNPSERQTRAGYEDRVPRTPEEFEQRWKDSPEYAELQRDIADYERQYPVGGGGELQAFRDYKRDAQAKHVRPKSPYVVSVFMQVKLNMKRAWQRIWNDKASTFTPIVSNVVMALIIGSVFYQTPDSTSGFTAKGATLFFAILLNALAAISEINSLYEQRPIVEKHKSYAFYHPSTEAVAGIVLDIPLKFAMAVAFNITLYFMAGLRAEAGNFFLFFLINFTSMFVMAAVFRTMAAVTKTISQAMALSGIFVLAIVIYTGFVVPVEYMKDWFGWIRWINPIFYAFEILIANEFHGRRFDCADLVPATSADLGGPTFICNARGAVAGELTVSGDAFIQASYSYSYDHVWRNFGILLAFLFGFMAAYFVAVELNSETTSTAEVLVFRRGTVPKSMADAAKGGAAKDAEMGAPAAVADTAEREADDGGVHAMPPQTDIFTWRDVSYDIEIKGQSRRLLDEVSGYVKPGTLTALMGTSGAGKTTLLDVLAQRTTVGVVTGSMFVNGAPLDSSFQRKTGYVQQQDLHLETATVRESLRFSAMLRQPPSVSRAEKYAYVEDVIRMLNMQDFAEAVVGVPGEGLNVEQRKLLTIGVELAAKPKLLLFLDEPTSGLDSQSSWAICAFLRKLADSGQAVLCTIHQPSAILFQAFDRLLFLRKGGKTVYFGNIGENSHTLLDYFARHGARPCDPEENPAEYMLEVVGDPSTDWFQIWKDSPEAGEVREEIDRIHREQAQVRAGEEEPAAEAQAPAEFAMPFTAQLWEVGRRVFQQYWRMPSYVLAKMILCGASGLFIGFSFYSADSSLQGMQNVIYALFMVTTVFSTVVQQIMPLFVTQRSLYEVRERPSKAYSWAAFLMANIGVEIPYQIVAGVIVYATFYYPVVGIQDAERQGLVLLLCVVFFIYASTFAHMCIAALPDAQTAGAAVTFLFAMSLIFNGVMQPPDALPGFWTWMYHVSPMTYWVGAMAATMLHDRPVACSPEEMNVFQPPSGQTCGAYMQPSLATAAGSLLNPDATRDCNYCSRRVADTVLAGSEIFWSERWRNFGLMWAYVAFNTAAAVLLYYLFRVRNRAGLRRRRSRPTAAAPAPCPPQPQPHHPDRHPPTPATAPSAFTRAATWTGVASTAQNYANRYVTSNLGRVHTNRRNAQII